jgi:Cu+-exporting ATPase
MIHKTKYRIKNQGGEIVAKDPVCNMMVDEKTAKLKTKHEGKSYYFCSEMCLKKFNENPEKYVS